MAFVINQELCSCCHRCRVECPAGAIRFRSSKYWIDPELCISCGHCAQVCHNDVISDPDSPPAAVQAHPPLSLDCDVLVVGGGASGLAAGAKAAEEGKKVLVLEKNKEIGGSAWYAHVFRSIYSQWHEQAGLPDERDKLYREFMEATQGHVNGKLLRRIIDTNVELIDWLIQRHGLGRDYDFGPQFWGGYGPRARYDWEYNHKRIDTTIGPGGTGWYMTNKLCSIIQDNGGQILCRTAVERLILGADGAVCGVQARDPGGTVTVSCRSVVIAAGAFSRNKELTGRFNPIFYSNDPKDEPVHVFACATCTGDGIAMCREIGADIDYHNARAGMFGPMRHPFGTAGIAAACSRYHVEVNAEGEPFTGKGFGEAVSDLAHEPGRITWRVMDEASVIRAEREAEGRPEDVPGCDMNRFYANWRAELEEELGTGSLYRGDTLAELAAQIGVPEEKLEAAVAAYNASAGVPETVPTPEGPKQAPPKDPMKHGPYYAFLMKLFHENSIGGIVIDENMQVLKNGCPIPGLYAAGDNTRGIMLPGRVGASYIESTISALTFALCSGYAAGAEAAGMGK